MPPDADERGPRSGAALSDLRPGKSTLTVPPLVLPEQPPRILTLDELCARDAEWWGDNQPPAPPPCPPEHQARTQAARAGKCARHGCPLCGIWMNDGARPDGPTGHCYECDRRAIRVIEHESPVPDPWCGCSASRGIPTPESRRACEVCDMLVRAAKHKGWAFPGTGHDGPDCVHCDVCGLCKASGRVCRCCWRCLDHPWDSMEWGEPSCVQWQWSRAGREERHHFEHELWSPETWLWDS
jgi:hypothetical protein